MYSNESLFLFMIYTVDVSFLISGRAHVRAHTHTKCIYSVLLNLLGVWE